MENINRFTRYEEEFLNSSKIVSRALSQLQGTNGNAGQI